MEGDIVPVVECLQAYGFSQKDIMRVSLPDSFIAVFKRLSHTTMHAHRG